MRVDGREADQLREVKIEPNYLKHPEGSALVQFGDTKVICTASVEERVPPFMRGEGKGWVTAEYSMLPRATQIRNPRESTRGKVGGRTMEIQRLVGRALRSVVDLEKLGERTIWIDCDVIQADGGTRTASITGGFVAMVLAIQYLMDHELLRQSPITDSLAAISVGVVQGVPMLDLCYEEDSHAKVDMNVVMTGNGKFVELQGTGEESPFSTEELTQLIQLARKGITVCMEAQRKALGDSVSLIGTNESATKEKEQAKVQREER